MGGLGEGPRTGPLRLIGCEDADEADLSWVVDDTLRGSAKPSVKLDTGDWSPIAAFRVLRLLELLRLIT